MVWFTVSQYGSFWSNSVYLWHSKEKNMALLLLPGTNNLIFKTT